MPKKKQQKSEIQMSLVFLSNILLLTNFLAVSTMLHFSGLECDQGTWKRETALCLRLCPPLFAFTYIEICFKK